MKTPPEVLERIIREIEAQYPNGNHEHDLKVAMENVEFYYSTVLPALQDGTSPTEQEVVDILVDSCLVQKNFEEGLVYFATKVQERGLAIEIDQLKYRTWVEKLSQLRLYRKLVNAMGLSAFEQELMHVAIENMLGRPIMHRPEVKNNGNEKA